MAIDKAIDSGVLDANLTVVAQAIRAKGGTTQPLAFPAGFKSAIEAIETGITPEGSLTITENGTYDVTGKAQAVVSVPVPNYRRWTGTFTSTITGASVQAVLAEDEIIGQVAGLDSLLVRVTTDFSGNDAYTLLGCTATNSKNVIDDVYYQFIHRFGGNAGVFSDRGGSTPLTATTNLNVGQLWIAGNQLKWVVNSNNYVIRPCNYVVEMMWGGDWTYTNQIPISTDTDGSIYNGTGFMADMYLSNGVPAARTGIVTTGFIPLPETTSISWGQAVIRVSDAALAMDTSTRIALYDADKTYKVTLYASKFATTEPDTSGQYDTLGWATVDSDGYLASVDLSAVLDKIRTSTAAGLGFTPAYMRLCGAGINADTVLTINQEITT